MQLDDTQRAKVMEWVRQGMKLSEVQNRLVSDFGIKMTYMEVRLLVDDLKVTPPDPEPAPTQKSSPDPAPPAAQETVAGPPKTSDVSVSVDQLTRPGALVSGKVVFSDGMQAQWYMDESGRLGIAPQQQGYRPSAPDVQKFQTALNAELAKLGF